MRTASLLLTASVACAWSSPIKRDWSQGEGDDAVGHAYTEIGQGGGDDAVGHAYTETSSRSAATGTAGQGQGNNAAGSTLTENGGGQGAPGSTATEAAGQGQGNNAAGSTLTENGGGQGAPGSTATVSLPGSAVPIPSGSGSDNTGGGDGGVPGGPGYNSGVNPRQTFSFLSPTVDFQPAGLWKTSNLDAFTESGPANASVSVAGSGIFFRGRGNPEEWTVYVNGTAGDQLKSTSWGWDAIVNIRKEDADHPAFVKTTASVSGLEYGYYVFTLGSSGNLTFNTAEPNNAGERYRLAPANATKIGQDSHVKKEGNWEGEDGVLYTKAKGAKLTITVPQATAMLELRAGQPPVPFADFRVTITPPPLYGPSVQEFHPNLQGGGISALIYNGNIPIYSTLLNPNFNYNVVVETTSDQDEAFSVHDITYYP
ncbi:hypothetical protein A1Q1_03693 [Trichosporon asahii var. asahii CBS 2479]|uniref:Uncharacterized protein n=1 Tax=Trichosporon asahii var. asahii (strain ATCC 90039 / CBS 2479 / JCM 2466 / KCTC 7840 / NBRC 103889/ NCYC 2677 / UAMH 7654) TaxID=1186058 RepID=J5QHX5_TRIAS|nr:hypothetical protein A1Q1_03693 [Trichosporon asahii var. asahii CBS 2479]EJT47438.1 hypothetical protein A1Q1_03693 [Trichosporon asahii var. asahii CBS 2479]